MKQLLSIIFTFLLTSVSISAQTTRTSVSGSVADKEGEALAGSTVLFLQSDTIAGGTVTDSKGKFELKGLPAGEYECRVSMIGFKSEIRKFSLTGKVKLPQFVLEEDATALDEVTVSAGMRSKELAGMSIYYLSDRAKKESNTYYALQEIPRLRVNPTEKTIRLDDGSSPLILVNGVKKTIDVIDPSFIESIEVIDNPSARYQGDAAVSSVLNLKLKKEGLKPYIYGYLSARATPNANFIYSGGSFEIGSATSSLYATGAYMQTDKMKTDFFSDIYQGNLHREENGKTTRRQLNPWAQIGGDKEFSKKDYLAFSIKYMAVPSRSESASEGDVSDLNTGEVSSLTSSNHTRDRHHQLIGNLYYKHSFRNTRTLELSGDYFYSLASDRANRQAYSSIYSYSSAIDLDNSRHMGKFDVNFSDMLSKSLHLEVGSNTEYSVTNIDDLLDALPNFRYQRTREYIYTGIDNNRSSTARFNYSISLGLDMVFSDAAGEKHNYIDFVPSVSISYKLPKNQNISLLYSRRRSMPSPGYLNPLNTSSDSLQINMGNPLLNPSHTDRVKLGYVFNRRGFRLNPYLEYSYISDIIQPFGYMDGDIYVSTYQNFGHKAKLNAGITGSYNIPNGKAVYGNVSITAEYQKDYIKGMPYSGNSFLASINGFIGYKRISTSLFLGSYTPDFTYSLYSKTKNNILSSYFSFSWTVIDPLQLSVTAESFVSPKPRSEVWTINGDYISYVSTVTRSLSPKISFGITYNFATKNFKWRNKKQFYSSDSGLNSVTTN